MATPLQIGGLINLEERSGSFLPELPYTNRGVIRQKEELSALIDLKKMLNNKELKKLFLSFLI